MNGFLPLAPSHWQRTVSVVPLPGSKAGIRSSACKGSGDMIEPPPLVVVRPGSDRAPGDNARLDQAGASGSPGYKFCLR